jgi:hypothetical protein
MAGRNASILLAFFCLTGWHRGYVLQNQHFRANTAFCRVFAEAPFLKALYFPHFQAPLEVLQLKNLR